MPLVLSGVVLGNLDGPPASLTLNDLTDVTISSPSNGQVLMYDSATSKWENSTIDTDVYGFLETNLTSSNGVTLTKTPSTETVNISLSLTASGDATGSVTSGALGLTLATVNSNVGTYGSASAVPVITVDAKGRVTSVSTASISANATNISGGAAKQVPFQSAPSTTTFSSGFTFDSTTGTLSVGIAAATGTISSADGEALDVVSDVSIALKTNGSSRLAIGSNGAFTIGGSTGTAGQVLISNGSGSAPSWSTTPTITVNAANISGGAATQIPYQSAANTTAFSSKFKWTDSSNQLTIGNGVDNTFIVAANISSSSAAGDIRVVAPSNTGAGAGGAVILFGGPSSGAGTGGGITLNPGTSYSGTGGGINITSGTSSTGPSSGSVIISTGISSTTAGTSSGAVTISTGYINNNTGTAGLLTVNGGDVISAKSGTAGTVLIRGGNSATGVAGNVDIRGGIGGETGGTGGYIKFSTGPLLSMNERFRISNTGALGIGNSVNYGTAGQVLISNGSSTSPSWSSNPTIGTVTVTDVTFGTGANIDDDVLVTSATTANQVVTTLPIATYRSAKFQIQVASGSSYMMTEINMIHNGTTVFMTEFGTVMTGTSLASFDADISGGNMRLLVTPVNAVTTIEVLRTALTV